MSDGEASQTRTNWKWIGFVGSALYGTFFLALVWFTWPQVLDLELNALGDFFAGLFAPLALLWLVLGFFQQGEELRLQAEELRASVEQASQQVDALKVSSEHSRFQAIAIINESFEARVANAAESLVRLISSHPSVDGGWSFNTTSPLALRSRYAQGNRDVFFEELWNIEMTLDSGQMFVNYFAMAPEPDRIRDVVVSISEELEDWFQAVERVGGVRSDVGRATIAQLKRFESFRNRVLAATPT